MWRISIAAAVIAVLTLAGAARADDWYWGASGAVVAIVAIQGIAEESEGLGFRPFATDQSLGFSVRAPQAAAGYVSLGVARESRADETLWLRVAWPF